MIIDEYSRECLAILVARRLRSDDVLHLLAGPFADCGPPDHIRSDNGPEFTAKAVRTRLGRIGVKTPFIERRRRHDNTIRPHGSPGYRPPAPETVIPGRPDQAFHRHRV